jgi:hypothetical protein
MKQNNLDFKSVPIERNAKDNQNKDIKERSLFHYEDPSKQRLMCYKMFKLYLLKNNRNFYQLTLFEQLDIGLEIQTIKL